MADEILFITPTTPVKATIRQVMDELGYDYPVHEATMQEAVDLARIYIERGTKVVVSYGGTANLLKQALPVYVIEIRYNSFDLIKNIHKALAYSERIAVVGFESVIYNARQISQFLASPLIIRQVASIQEVLPVVTRLRDEGVEAFVGGSAVVNAAKKVGCVGIYLDADKRCIRDAIEESVRVLQLKEEEEKSFGTTRAFLNSLAEGLIGLDGEGFVNEANQVAADFLAMGRAELMGRPVREIIPNVSSLVGDTLKNGSEWYGEALTIGDNMFSVNCVPAVVKGEYIGAVLTLREQQQVQSMEQKIRNAFRISGHAARKTLADVIGECRVMAEVKEQAETYAKVDSTVLVYGETGTGKELLAQGLHNASRRAANPFVAINCAALPESLLESELFGYVKGAFTGAKSNGKMGLFEIAHSGTIFLDEIGEMALPLQSRLLRVLEEKEIWRIGDSKTTPVDIRVIAATNRDLAACVREETFREDLYYRLSVLIINLPPLRERKEDLKLLADSILHKKGQMLNRRLRPLDDESVALLKTLDWPGNIRQLSNVLERAAVMCRGGQVTYAELHRAIRSCSQSAVASRSDPARDFRLNRLENRAILDALDKCGGNRRKTAEMLGISHSTLWRKLRAMVEGTGASK